MVSGGPAVDPVIDNPSFSTPAFINRHSSIGIHQSAFINSNQQSAFRRSTIGNCQSVDRQSAFGNRQ